MVSSSPLRFLRFSSPRTELVLPFWPDGDDGDESFCPQWVTTANRGERCETTSPRLLTMDLTATHLAEGALDASRELQYDKNGDFSYMSLPLHPRVSASYRSHTIRKRNRTERANLSLNTLGSLLRTRLGHMIWPGRVRRLILSFLLDLVAPSVEREGRIIRHWPRFATNLVQAIARGLSSVLIDRTQDDLPNPERRAALSAGWACLEWSGTSGTAAHPGRGKVF
ncbi:hypothetical protein EDB85DRAFT_445516 [Lactarius pseudohatsudake]|nr:hypothetical protein EDB85DRAFT_445516 [Lactarius pseudohatsudake]